MGKEKVFKTNTKQRASGPTSINKKARMETKAQKKNLERDLKGA